MGKRIIRGTRDQDQTDKEFEILQQVSLDARAAHFFLPTHNYAKKLRWTTTMPKNRSSDTNSEEPNLSKTKIKTRKQIGNQDETPPQIMYKPEIGTIKPENYDQILVRQKHDKKQSKYPQHPTPNTKTNARKNTKLSTPLD